MTRDWLPALQGLPGGFGPWAQTIGMTLVEVRADLFRVTWSGAPQLTQPVGLVNGGVHCTVTETLASIAAAIHRLEATLPQDAPTPDLSDPHILPAVVGISNQTDFYRPLRDEQVTSTATPIHLGRSQQVWQVVTVDQQDRLVARGQLRVQNL